MLFGTDVSIWLVLLLVLAVPAACVGFLKLLLRRRGGAGPGWGAALAVTLAGCCSLLAILDKVQL